MKKRKIKLRFKLLMLVCFLAYMGFAIYSQQSNIGMLLEEQQALTAEYQQLQTKISRLQHKSEYMNTKDYIENQAREKFGLVYEDEYVYQTDAVD